VLFVGAFIEVLRVLYLKDREVEKPRYTPCRGHLLIICGEITIKHSIRAYDYM
jgi:hypothetical protein